MHVNKKNWQAKRDNVIFPGHINDIKCDMACMAIIIIQCFNKNQFLNKSRRLMENSVVTVCRLSIL